METASRRAGWSGRAASAPANPSERWDDEHGCPRRRTALVVITERDLIGVAGPDEVEVRALDHTCRLIIRDHPGVSPSRVAGMLERVYEQTADAPVQAYRLILAERNVRRRLRSEAADRDGRAF